MAPDDNPDTKDTGHANDVSPTLQEKAPLSIEANPVDGAAALADASSPDPLKRASAALSLGRLSTTTAIRALAHLLRDEHPVVRAAAAQALATLDSGGDRKPFWLRPGEPLRMPLRPMKDNGMVTG